MSNGLGIAAVTTAFGQRIAEALQAVPNLSSAPELRWGRPASDPSFVGVNVFLYRVSPNGSRRNEDLATRAADGSVLKRPQAALDLDYLISFHGDEAALEPQRLMGAVIASLHASPILPAERIRDAIAATGAYGMLAGAEYALTASPIRFTLQALDLDAFYRIWSLFTQVPYTLSVAYTGTTLMLEADLVPVRALPVRAPGFSATPSLGPAIRSIVPPAVPYGNGASVLVSGDRFSNDQAQILVGGWPFPAIVDAGTITLAVPAGLPAGVTTVQVVCGAEAPATSAAATFILQPRVADGVQCRPAPTASGGTGGLTITCNLMPLPLPAQTATLFLNPLPPALAGQFPQSSGVLRRTSLDPSLAGDLATGGMTPALQAALAAAGIEVASDTAVQTLATGQIWRLIAGDGTACRLVSDGGLVTVYPGLAADYPDGTVAFTLPAIAGGVYIASVQIGPDAGATSPLRLGTPLCEVPVAADPVDGGVLPSEIVAGLATARIAISPAPTVARAMPGDGWQFQYGRQSQDPTKPQGYWLERASPTTLRVYALDVPGGTFFGPAVTVPAGTPT